MVGLGGLQPTAPLSGLCRLVHDRAGTTHIIVNKRFIASAGTLFIAKSKGGQQRYVHLDPEAARFFREVCTNRDLGQTIFLRESGEPWVKDSQKRPKRRACTLAKIKRFGFHQLRHSAASRWITLGVSLKVVAEQLGHVVHQNGRAILLTPC
jgi:integrase